MNTRTFTALLAIFLSSALFSTHSLATEFSISDYGLLPQSRAVSISPDAKHYAAIVSADQKEFFGVSNTETGKLVTGVRLGDLKARNIYFINEDHIIYTASETTRALGYRGRFEGSGSFVMDIKTKKLKILLNKTENLHPAQPGLGRVVGFNAKEDVVYMPAYSKATAPPYNLYRVGLKRGLGTIYRKGNASTIDWFMGENGRVLAREDYNNKRQEHIIYSYLSGKRKQVYKKKTDRPSINIAAVSADETSLVFLDGNEVFNLSLNDGAISKASFNKDAADAPAEYIKTDLNRKITAVRYSGLLPFEVLADPTLNRHYAALQNTLLGTNISLEDIGRDKQKFVIKVSGNESSGMYLLYDVKTNALKPLGREYANINREHIGQIVPVTFTARDGRKVPSIMTWPTGVAKGSKKNLPLIVLPHGGPAIYDYIKFHWWAQYLARKGYLVLQPNFRGSTGFGYQHQAAGDREWGKAMQDDVSDGVGALVKAGHADPNRVCIMGASYGGYSALAGGAFSPDLYKCVVSVAGVTDLPRMLSNTKMRFGSNHWVNRYWEQIVGDSKTEREKLKDISPSKFAEKFVAPVLLIHGKDDTIVPFSQSRIMHKALRKAGKTSELVTLKGEDHWLSKSSTRLDMLKAIDKFLDKHNPI